jgi:hypothetical protein
MKKTAAITAILIAPCGMNCGICSGHLREKKPCPGCMRMSEDKPGYCRKCIIRFCRKANRRQGKYCYDCKQYPCLRLRQLDKRYRARYGMSMLENLALLKTKGVRALVRREQARWKCPNCGGVLCVHKPNCMFCGSARPGPSAVVPR